MKVSLVALVASALLGTAAAGHQHHHERRHGHMGLHKKNYPRDDEHAVVETPTAPENESCECTTIWSTWYGEATLVPPPPPPPAEPKPTKEPEPEPEPEPKPPKQPNSMQDKPPKNEGLGGGKRWGMTYSPYKGESTSSTSCKSSGEVSSDIAAIAAKGFQLVRIYSTDCDHLPSVIPALREHGMDVILGVFIKEGGIGDETRGQVQDIVSYFDGDYGMVRAVLVGNEALFSGHTSAGQLASFVGEAKQTLKSAGYSGPVGTAETVDNLQANAAELAPVLDIVGAQVHPFFASAGHVRPEDAGGYVREQIELVKEHYHVEVINSETGWPTQGPDNGGAHPSVENQRAAIESMMDGAYAGKTIYFSDSNDGWKNTGEPSVEPYFGCGDVFN